MFHVYDILPAGMIRAFSWSI